MEGVVEAAGGGGPDGSCCCCSCCKVTVEGASWNAVVGSDLLRMRSSTEREGDKSTGTSLTSSRPYLCT